MTPASDPAFPVDDHDRLGAAEWTDTQLLDHVARAVRRPRDAEQSSFLLHAPLELLARARLLGHVDDAHRRDARIRILGIAAQLDAAGPPIDEPPVQNAAADGTNALVQRLFAAVRAGDVDEADLAATVLGERVDAMDLATSTLDAVAASTAAAGHAPIFHHLAADWSGSTPATRLFRPLARALARDPEMRIGWVDDTDLDVAGRGTGAQSMFDALAATPLLGPPESTFIAPTMAAVDPEPAAGLVAPAVGGDPAAIGRDITRAAALTMVQESTEHAPYGWTHCLTMPLALIVRCDVAGNVPRLLAIAATHVVGFRGTLARNELRADLEPEPTEAHWREALGGSPEEATAAVWHAGPAEHDDIAAELVGRAAAAHDAHLVKYVVASLDAARFDPSWARVHLGAAARLAAWWHLNPDAGFTG